MVTQTKATISRKTADAFLTALEEAGVTDEQLEKAAHYPRAVRLIAEVIGNEDLRGAGLHFYSAGYSGYCR